MNAIPAATEETATIQTSCIAKQKQARLMLLQNMTLVSNCYGYEGKRSMIHLHN